MFEHREAEAVYSHFSSYLDDEARARLLKVDKSVKNEWSPIKFYKDLQGFQGSHKQVNLMGLLNIGAIYHSLSQKISINMVPYEFIGAIELFNLMTSSRLESSVLLTAGALLTFLSKSHILSHEFLHAASYQVAEPEILTEMAKKSGKEFETPSGVLWRDANLNIRGKVLNEGITIKKTFDIAPSGYLPTVVEAWRRLNFSASKSSGGGLRLAELLHTKLAKEFGGKCADDLENKLYFQGQRQEFGQALNDACRSNVFDHFMELADQKKIRQAEQLIKV